MNDAFFECIFLANFISKVAFTKDVVNSTLPASLHMQQMLNVN